MSVYGTILSGAQVEQAAIDHLQAWMPAYIAELERQHGRAPRSMTLPRAWKRSNEDFDVWPEAQLPAVILISPGFAGAPTKEGDGTYTATYGLAIGVLLNADKQQTANDNVKLYAAAISAAMVQHPSLGGVATGLLWTDLGYADVPTNYLKIGAAARLSFEVQVRGILNASKGPSAPPVDPYQDAGNRPTVLTTDLTLNAEAIT